MYQKREFQYEILANTPENLEAISQYIDPSGIFPNVVLVINTTLNVIDETFTSLAEAYDRYQLVGP